MNPIAPCPFCGHSRPTMVMDQIGGDVSAHVCCSNCLAQGPNEPTAEKAAERWGALSKKLAQVREYATKLCGTTTAHPASARKVGLILRDVGAALHRMVGDGVPR